MATVPPPPPPSLPELNITNITAFADWWDEHTFGLFGGILAGLFVLSVFLKTRSLSATLVAAIVVAGVASRSWALLVAALALAGLVWGLWRRSGE